MALRWKTRSRSRFASSTDLQAALRRIPFAYVAKEFGNLPIDRCSRAIVPQLERAGYEVRYREFDSGHVVGPEIAREAVGWFITEHD
jgi:predicted esterase